MGNKILITGIHRSGSSWVGDVLCSSGKLKMIGEPFNPVNQWRWDGKIFDWYKRIDDTDNEIIEKLRGIYGQRDLSFLNEQIAQLPSRKTKLNAIYEFVFQKQLFSNILVKDPIAFFSAEKIACEFDFKVVCVIRHPAAFIASVKEQNWRLGLDNLIKQDELINGDLLDWKNQIIEQNKQKDTSIVEHGCLLWNIFYSTALKYRERNINWIFITHEQISQNPEQEFKKLCINLGLPYNASIQKKIFKTSQKVNWTKPSYKTHHDFNRNSKTNIKLWKKRLTEDEIKLIKKKTKIISDQWYSEKNW